MPYYVILTIHLLCAFVFVGTVFFEVLVMHAVRRKVPPDVFAAIERAIGDRTRRLMPWVLALLYAAGIALAWQYRALLAHPLDSAPGTLLCIKIALAISVFGHFLCAMRLRRRGRLRGRTSRCLHLSVFAHVVVIVLLAKALFHVGW
ncbi:CopD family copper resistance protein [Lysobacter changpingensis]|uniref:CopD family copper resistance protein n=1 Tax=Lysobacter changpingensis TaxID=2792784 RepID=UPI001A8DE1F1|nr:hypothetical protein [Lysobacter changpingensis]